MKKTKSWLKIKFIGKKIKKFWSYISSKYKLDIEISGLDAMPSFNFKSKKNDYYKTFITQEMLKKKYLASNALFVSIKHDDKSLENYFNILDEIFSKISKFENNSLSINKHLEGPVCQSGFQRIN